MTYYGVRGVIKEGIKIPIQLPKSKLPGHHPFHLDSEVLVGVCSDGTSYIAPDITDRSEYQRWWEYSQERPLDWIGIYRLPKEKITNCTNEGRVPIGEVEKILTQK